MAYFTAQLGLLLVATLVQAQQQYYTSPVQPAPQYILPNNNQRPLTGFQQTVPAPVRPQQIRPQIPQQPQPFQPQPQPQNIVNTIEPFPAQPTQQMPQIENLEVQCSKDQMVVRIQFDRPYNGVIYSKGYFSNPQCRYVRAGSNRDLYEFTLSLNNCGSQFVDQFQAQGGQAYLENVIIFQNEQGIQEVWDQARRIRCLWQGQLDKTVSYALNVDMLEQQIVTFSGDSANAFMDVQVGKGPFAPTAQGLVKIGETMSIVIRVEGDSGFDIHVKECIAHPGDRNQAVQLTDSDGCVLKPKLMGPFTSTTQTGNTGASIIAFAFFQAFKFPDQMDVYLECNLELCKGQCDQCPTGGNPPIDVRGRKKRSADNGTDVSDPVRLGRFIRVVSPEDISIGGSEGAQITLAADLHGDDVCMSTTWFVTGVVIILLVLVTSCVITASMFVRARGIPGYGAAFPPPSFASFSTGTLNKAYD